MPQENNMAEVIRLLHTVIGKVDGLATGLNRVQADVQVLKTDVQILKTDVQILKTDVQVLKTDVRELRTDFSRLDNKLDVLGGQFRDVAGVVIEDTQRISGVEKRVDVLEVKAN